MSNMLTNFFFSFCLLCWQQVHLAEVLPLHSEVTFLLHLLPPPPKFHSPLPPPPLDDIECDDDELNEREKERNEK